MPPQLMNPAGPRLQPPGAGRIRAGLGLEAQVEVVRVAEAGVHAVDDALPDRQGTPVQDPQRGLLVQGQLLEVRGQRSMPTTNSSLRSEQLSPFKTPNPFPEIKV